jgi:hypothetical protein
MKIDSELQNLIDEYIKQVESKEGDLVGLKNNIDGIISITQIEFKKVIADLDVKFDANEISEEEYLAKLRAGKKSILEKTKEKLDSLLTKLT